MNPKDVYEMYCKHIKQKESKLEEKNKDIKITNIIVNFKNHNNNYLPHSKSTQLIFMGKTCNLYAENLDIYSTNKSYERIIDNDCVYNKIKNEFYYNNSVVYDHYYKKKRLFSANHKSEMKQLRNSRSYLSSPKYTMSSIKVKSSHLPSSAYNSYMNTINWKATSPSPSSSMNQKHTRSAYIQQGNNKQSKLTFKGFMQNYMAINKSNCMFNNNNNNVTRLIKRVVRKNYLDKYKMQKNDFYF